MKPSPTLQRFCHLKTNFTIWKQIFILNTKKLLNYTINCFPIELVIIVYINHLFQDYKILAKYLLHAVLSRLIIPWTWGNKLQNKMEVDGLSNDQFFFWLRFLDTFCSMGEWVLCVIANWEYRGVVFSCKIGCLHTSTWRSTAYCRYLIAKRQRNFTGNIDVRSSKTALVHTCIGPCPIKNIYMICMLKAE